MKLAISNIAWLPDEKLRVLDILKKHCVNAIEVAPSLLFGDPLTAGEEEIENARRFYKNHGISVVAMQALLFGQNELSIFKDKQVRNATKKYLAQIIRMAGLLNVKVMVFGSPMNRLRNGRPNSECIKISQDFFHKVGQIAAEYNTCFCIEPNAKEYGCDFITNTKEAVELVHLVDHPSFKLHMDAGVMALNSEDHQEVLRLAFPFMKHFHISEPFLNRITDNKSNHKSIGKTLKKLNYKGYISIEMKHRSDKENIGAVDECLEFAKKQYFKKS